MLETDIIVLEIILVLKISVRKRNGANLDNRSLPFHLVENIKSVIRSLCEPLRRNFVEGARFQAAIDNRVIGVNLKEYVLSRTSIKWFVVKLR